MADAASEPRRRRRRLARQGARAARLPGPGRASRARAGLHARVPGPRSGRARPPDRGMRVVSVNVGLPREVAWRGKTVTTAIFKEPVAGRVALRSLNLDGDRQADPTVHGGRGKAAHAYPRRHYRHWRAALRETLLPYGAFGWN